MKNVRLNLLYLVCAAAFLMLGSCSGDKDDTESNMNYGKASYSFQLKNDLTKICKKAEIYWIGPDGIRYNSTLDGGNKFTWEGSFTDKLFPMSSGFQVTLYLRDEADLDKEEYILHYSYMYLLEIYDAQGNRIKGRGAENTVGGTYPKNQLAEVIKGFNQQLSFFFRLNSDGSISLIHPIE